VPRLGDCEVIASRAAIWRIEVIHAGRSTSQNFAAWQLA